MKTLLAVFGIVSLAACAQSCATPQGHGPVPKHAHKAVAPKVQQHDHRLTKGRSCLDECSPGACDAAWSIKAQMAIQCATETASFCICRQPQR